MSEAKKLQDEEQKIRLKIVEAFPLFDVESKGYLTRSQLKLAFLYFLGTSPLTQEMSDIMETLKEPVTSGVLCRLLVSRLQRVDESTHIQHMFEALDVNNKGYITVDDFEQALKSTEGLGHVLKDLDVEGLFREADTDRNGLVGLREFTLIMKSTTESCSEP